MESGASIGGGLHEEIDRLRGAVRSKRANANAEDVDRLS
jgi:hypothetical protein